MGGTDGRPTPRFRTFQVYPKDLSIRSPDPFGLAERPHVCLSVGYADVSSAVVFGDAEFGGSFGVMKLNTRALRTAQMMAEARISPNALLNALEVGPDPIARQKVAKRRTEGDQPPVSGPCGVPCEGPHRDGRRN